MDDILRDYLTKCGVNDVAELTELERHDFEEWRQVLSAKTSIADIISFVHSEIDILNKELREAVKKDESRSALLITARIENYEALLLVAEAPEKQKQHIIEFIKSKL